MICTKYKDLAETTRFLLDNLTSIDASHDLSNAVRFIIYYYIKFKFKFNEQFDHFQLVQLPDTHEALYKIIKDTNKCVGLQLLTAISSSLFTIIYYLYRYSTSTEQGIISNTHERVHYVLGLAHRIGKLITYMVLGQNIVESVSIF